MSPRRAVTASRAAFAGRMSRRTAVAFAAIRLAQRIFEDLSEQTAVLIGEVHAPVISIEEGAKFQGVSDMGVTAWPEEAPRLPGNVRDMTSHRGKTVALIGKDPDL